MTYRSDSKVDWSSRVSNVPEYIVRLGTDIHHSQPDNDICHYSRLRTDRRDIDVTDLIRSSTYHHHHHHHHYT